MQARDGLHILERREGQALRLWDEAAAPRFHLELPSSLRLSPDGSRLAEPRLTERADRLWDTQPLAPRHQARREADALRPEAERLVERLFAALREPDQVAAPLRSDPTLSDALRHAALRAVMRRGRSGLAREQVPE